MADEDATLFRTVYCLAKEDIPSSKINSFLTLQRLNGLNVEYKNLSHDTTSDIQDCIVKLLDNDLLFRLKKSPVLGLTLDESTDISVEKKLVLCIKYLEEGFVPKTEYLTNIKLPAGDSDTIVTVLADTFQSLGIPLASVVSLATDGASTMMGKRNGVGVQLKDKYCPYLVHTHCLAHRLALGCGDSLKDNSVIRNFRNMFNGVYAFFHTSANRTSLLSEMQGIYNDPVLKMKEPHEIRWLSVYDSVEAVFRSYPSLVATFKSLSSNATASGYHTYFQKEKNAYLTAYFADIHSELSLLSKTFQRDNLHFIEVKGLIETTVNELQEIVNKDGGSHVRKMQQKIVTQEGRCCIKDTDVDIIPMSEKEKEDLKTAVESYVNSVVKNLRKRLSPHAADIFHSFAVLLDPLTHQESEEIEITDALKQVKDFYATDDESVEKMLDSESLPEEYKKLRVLIKSKGVYSGLTFSNLCKRVLRIHDKLPNMQKLCQLASCQLITSVECERSFSIQNKIKTAQRSQLSVERLDVLMKLKLRGPDIEEYKVEKAVRYWDKLKNRRKKRLKQPYKPRKMAKFN